MSAILDSMTRLAVRERASHKKSSETFFTLVRPLVPSLERSPRPHGRGQSLQHLHRILPPNTGIRNALPINQLTTRLLLLIALD